MKIRVQIPDRKGHVEHLRGYVPRYSEATGLWLYGNEALLSRSLALVPGALGHPCHTQQELESVEAEAERLVLNGAVLVCGVHSEAHRRVAVVALRWGAPRIVVLSGGFCSHLTSSLNQEPFRQARLWRYLWDPATDLAISRRAPEKLPTYARHNPTVDRLIARIASGELGRHFSEVSAPAARAG